MYVKKYIARLAAEFIAVMAIALSGCSASDSSHHNLQNSDSIEWSRCQRTANVIANGEPSKVNSPISVHDQHFNRSDAITLKADHQGFSAQTKIGVKICAIEVNLFAPGSDDVTSYFNTTASNVSYVAPTNKKIHSVRVLANAK